jgi:hypothetical protein
MLGQLTDPRRFPALTAFIAAGVFDTADEPDDEFVFGLDRILDGVEALVTRLRLEDGSGDEFWRLGRGRGGFGLGVADDQGGQQGGGQDGDRADGEGSGHRGGVGLPGGVH